MKFKFGAAVGFAAGYWVATQSSEQRRAELQQTLQRIQENPRVRRISDVVTRDAQRIGDAVERRVVAGAEQAADKIAGPADDVAGRTGTAAGTGAGEATQSAGTTLAS